MSSDLKTAATGSEGTKKAPGEILQEEIQEGRAAIRRSTGGLFLSGLSAGLDIGFGLFLSGVALTVVGGSLPRPISELLLANMIAVGFVFVVLGRSELFTEQTTLAVLPVLNGKASVGSLLRVWVVVYVANLVGAAMFAALAATIGPALAVIEPSAFEAIATAKTSHPGWVIFLSALLAGWLMGLLSWLVAATRDTISVIAITWLIGAVIGFAHLHHVVAGSVEVLAGVFAGRSVSATDYAHFLLWTTLGNAIGGPLFVSVLKYGHAIGSSHPSARTASG